MTDTKRKPRNYSTVNSFLLTLLRDTVGKEYSVSNDSLEVLNSFCLYQVHQNTAASEKVLQQTSRRTMQYGDLKTALEMNLSSDDYKNVVNAMTNAVKKFTVSKQSMSGKDKKTQSVRAGLILPVGRIESFIKAQLAKRRIANDFYVALTAAIEYMCRMWATKAAEVTKKQGNKRIMPKHLQQSLPKSFFRNGQVPVLGHNAGLTL